MLGQEAGVPPEQSKALLGVGVHLLLVASRGHSLHVRTEDTNRLCEASRPLRRPKDSQSKVRSVEDYAFQRSSRPGCQAPGTTVGNTIAASAVCLYCCGAGSLLGGFTGVVRTSAPRGGHPAIENPEDESAPQTLRAQAHVPTEWLAIAQPPRMQRHQGTETASDSMQVGLTPRSRRCTERRQSTPHGRLYA